MKIDVDIRLGVEWEVFADCVSYSLPHSDIETLSLARAQEISHEFPQQLVSLTATKRNENGEKIAVLLPLPVSMAKEVRLAPYIAQRILEELDKWP